MKSRREYRTRRRGSEGSDLPQSADTPTRLRNPLSDLQHSAGNHAVQELLRGSLPEQAQEVAPSVARTSKAYGVEQALGSGRPLDAATRDAMGQKLGADFSEVRIHDGTAAAESARRMHAVAYTLGNHIVFGDGGLAPHLAQGRNLLAHELAHTVQQTRDPRPRIQREPVPGDTVDVDLAPESQAEADRLKAAGMNQPTVSQGTWQASGGSPYSTLLPGYSQQGESCGAASLVSALLIWDREHWDPAQPNSRAVDACDVILLELERHGADAAARLAIAHPLPKCAGDHACDVAQWTAFRDLFTMELTQIRNTARTPGGKVQESGYQQMGLSLYFLWNQGHGSGLGAPEIFQIQRSLGLNTTESTGLRDFDAIFTNDIVRGLGPDEMAQVFWIVAPTGQQHAFIIGRLSTGKWFLSDQGPSPAVQFQTDSLGDLHSSVRTAASTGSYWLYTGSTQSYIDKTGLMPGYTGVQKLAGAGGTHQAVVQTVPAGSQLGQVDAGYFTIGDDITCVSYVGRQYTLDEAKSSLPAATGGGLIVELPAGVFTVYLTSAVSGANLNETSLDQDDSSKMLLGGGHAFHHAWLILGNRFGLRRAWFQVY